MKKLFPLAATAAKTLCLVATVAAAFSLASCGDDDDDDGGSGSAAGNYSAGYIETPTGTTLRVKSVGDVVFEYDDEGKMINITSPGDDEDFDFDVSYNPLAFTMYRLYGDEDDEWYSVEVTLSSITVNADGYITSMKIKEADEYGSEYETESATKSGTMKMTYDANGHLTKVTNSESVSVKYVEDGDTYGYSYSTSSSASLTWDGELLEGVEGTYTASASGFSEQETYSLEFGNSGSYPNTIYQWTPTTAEAVLIAGFQSFLDGPTIAGYMGKAPSYHPVSMSLQNVYIMEFDDDDEEEDEYEESSSNYTCSYTFNDYGVVDTGYLWPEGFENVWGYSYVFDYELVGAANETDAGVKTRSSLNQSSESLGSLFARHRRELVRKMHRNMRRNFRNDGAAE